MKNRQFKKNKSSKNKLRFKRMKLEFKMINKIHKKNSLLKKPTTNSKFPKHLCNNKAKNRNGEKIEQLNRINKMEDKS